MTDEIKKVEPATELAETSPKQIIAKATEMAKELKKIVEDCKLYVELEGKKYVLCEGWTTLATFAGCTVGIEKVDEVIEREKETVIIKRWNKKEKKEVIKKVEIIPYTVKATAFLMKNGQIISKAEAECSNREKNWADKERFAIKSMAQTRAVSKVCRIALSWIVRLAGYEATPAEEITEIAEVEVLEPTITKEVEEEPTVEIEPEFAPIEEKPKPKVKVERTEDETIITFTPPDEREFEELTDALGMKKPFQREIKLIHTLLTKLKVPDALYRKYLREKYSVSSSKDLKADELTEVINTLRKIEAGRLKVEEVFK